MWPGTHRTRSAPGWGGGSRSRKGQAVAREQKDLKTACEESVERERRRVATSRLSRQSHKSLAKRAVGKALAALAPARAAFASASKTSLFGPREKHPRNI